MTILDKLISSFIQSLKRLFFLVSRVLTPQCKRQKYSVLTKNKKSLLLISVSELNRFSNLTGHALVAGRLTN